MGVNPIHKNLTGVKSIKYGQKGLYGRRSLYITELVKKPVINDTSLK